MDTNLNQTDTPKFQKI